MTRASSTTGQLAAFGLAGFVVAWIVVVVTFFFSNLGGTSGRWSDLMLALGLAGLFVGLQGARFGRDEVLIGLESVGLLALWWLAAPDSPIPGRVGIDRDAYLPLATAAYALVVAWLGIWTERRAAGGVVDPSETIRAPRRVLLVRFTSWLGFGLGIVAAYFSVWSSGRVAFLALLLASSALAYLALGWRRVESAYAGA